MENDTDMSLIELGAPILGELEKHALCAVIDDGWLTMGARVRRFEQAFAKVHGVEDAIAVSSATAALHLSLQAFDIGPGDEVLVPSLTFVATANVIVQCGATPVFVDIDAVECPHISLAEAQRKLTSRTRAVMIVHYGGYMVDVQAWREFADGHGLLLFEDAAHVAGMGGIGTLSDAASFSFFANKNMTTAEGGMMIVRDPGRHARARRMRAHGMTTGTLDRALGRAVGYDVVDCGHNFRMDELRAALGLAQLDRLLVWNETRRALTARYRLALKASAPDIIVPFPDTQPSSGHIMPVLLPPATDRAHVMAAMLKQRVQTSMHYPPIHQFQYYRTKCPTPALPNTELFCERELTVPLHARMSTSDVDRVVMALTDAVHARRDA